MGPIYLLTLRQLSGRWRIMIMTLLGAMPVLITMMMLRSDEAASIAVFETTILGAMLAGSIAPLIVLAIAAPAFANEVEDRTLANLTLSPLPRWKIVLAKLLGAVTMAAPFIAASAYATSQMAFLGDGRATFAVTTAVVAGVAMYASAFVWLGLVSTQAIGIGLLYIVLWEGFFAGFVEGVRLLSIQHYATALMHAIDGRRFADADHVGGVAALTIAGIIVAGFLLFSIRRLRRMDVP